MKKSNFLSFLLGMIAVGGLGVFALSSQYLKSDGTPDFQKLKSTANSNQLNAEMRDQLMDGLSKMQDQIQAQQAGGVEIPAGAVMAFDTTNCPKGWTRFADADGRFIMGNSTNSREKGGNKSIKLYRQNIPPHSHWFADTIFSENVKAIENNISSFNNSNGFPFGINRGIGGAETLLGSKANRDNDNSLISIRRKTGGSILRSGIPESTKYTYNGRTYANGAYFASEQNIDNGNKEQQPFDITNPYIKLLYCKKN